MTRIPVQRNDTVNVVDIRRDKTALGMDPERLRLLVDRMTDYAIIRLDARGKVDAWSESAERIKGYRSDEILGQDFSIFFTPEDRAAGLPVALLEDARAVRNIHRMGWRVHKDGHLFWGEISLTALYSDNGQLTGYVKLVRDLSERHEAEETLRRSEELYRMVVGNVTDYATVGLDPRGIIETWNAGAERIKGYSEDEIVGKHFSIFYSPEDRAVGVPARVLNQARESGHAEHSGWRVRKDGSHFWSDIVLTALRDADGDLVGYVQITRDLSERHAAELAARRAAERDEQANNDAQTHQMRLEFMQSISHDLRMPLTAIKAYAWLLRMEKESDPQERVQFLLQIEEGADRINGMVSDLLELTMLESGAIELNFEDVRLRRAAESTVALLRPVLDARCVDVRVLETIDVRVDASALHRILVNLIGNAAKFTPEETSITVDAETIGDKVAISVSDEGPGVMDSEKKAIFQRFRQGIQPAVQKRNGSGIGLSMVRDYVDLHGGRVWVEDSAGGGAKFVFTMPLCKNSIPAERSL